MGASARSRWECGGTGPRVSSSTVGRVNLVSDLFNLPLRQSPSLNESRRSNGNPKELPKLRPKGSTRGELRQHEAKTPEIRRLRVEGIGPTEIAKRLGISRASIYRVLNLSV